MKAEKTISNYTSPHISVCAYEGKKERKKTM